MAGFFADAVMIVHFAFLVFLVLGGFLAWRWPRVLIAHLAAAAWGIGIVVFEWLCPLTYVENWFRQAAGQSELSAGFIDTYVTGVIYPGDRITEVRLVVATIVAVSWIGLAVLWRRSRRTPSAPVSR